MTPSDPDTGARPDQPPAQSPAQLPDFVPSPTTVRAARLVTVASVALMAVLALAWELWLAPLRPGGSMLALKALPLLAALPGLVRGRMRTFQAWSLLLMVYLTEGLVRATSDQGTSAVLAWVETALAVAAFGAILVYTGAHKRPKPPKPPRTRD